MARAAIPLRAAAAIDNPMANSAAMDSTIASSSAPGFLGTSSPKATMLRGTVGVVRDDAGACSATRPPNSPGSAMLCLISHVARSQRPGSVRS